MIKNARIDEYFRGTRVASFVLLGPPDDAPHFAMGRDDAYDAKTGELSTIRDDPESIKARDSDGALVLVTHVAPTYVRSWAIPAAEAEDIVKNCDKQDIPTVPELCGVRLAVRRDNPGECENLFAGYLMAQPFTGLPPPQYMHGHQKKFADIHDIPSVGPITVVRRDLGSFGAPDMRALYDLMHEIVAAYNDDGHAGDEWARSQMSVSAFQTHQLLRPSGLTQGVFPPPHLLRPRVRIKGLVGKPTLNGKLGYRDAYDHVKKRWSVFLDGTTGMDKPLGIKTDNLELFKDNIVACGKSCANAVEDQLLADRRRCDREGKPWISQEELAWAAFSDTIHAFPQPE